MTEADRLQDLTTDELSRYLADSALEMAQAQNKLNAALDEMSHRIDTIEAATES